MFFRCFGFWYAGLPGDGSTVPSADWPLFSAGNWVGERISVSADVGLQAMRDLLGDPSFLPNADDEMCLKVLSYGGKNLFDAVVAPKIRFLLSQQEAPPPPPPPPPPPVQPPAPSGLHPLSPASVRVEELRDTLVGVVTRVSFKDVPLAAMIYDVLAPEPWPNLKPFAVEALRAWRRFRSNFLGDTREIPAEDR